jgi:methionyl-tRNA synthetase
MLDKATVTMQYNELKEIIDENTKLKNQINEIKRIENMIDEEFEKNPLKKGLDKIFDLLEEANKYTKAVEKQHFIYRAMEEYCNALNIPTSELLVGIEKGIKLKV